MIEDLTSKSVLKYHKIVLTGGGQATTGVFADCVVPRTQRGKRDV